MANHTRGGVMKKEQVRELLYQALETELGRVQIYTTALRCVINEELKEEWQKYLKQTQNHVRIVEGVMLKFGLNPQADTLGRAVVRQTGGALVKGMEMALDSGDDVAAELVAAESVVMAETKDHLNWHLIGEVGKSALSEAAKVLKAAHQQVEGEADEHLYHSTGWARELWIDALGMKAVLPPPAEVRQVKTSIGAPRAQQVQAHMH